MYFFLNNPFWRQNAASNAEIGLLFPVYLISIKWLGGSDPAEWNFDEIYKRQKTKRWPLVNRRDPRHPRHIPSWKR